MIVIYAHCRLSVKDLHKWNENPMIFDTPVIPPHVHETMKLFNKYKIWFYSSNPATDLKELEYPNVETFRHENKAVDFGIYKTGIQRYYEEGLNDDLIIMNCGAMNLRENTYRINSWMNYDFSGITYNTTERVPHLQTYFIVFSRKVVNSEVFRDYWTKTVKYEWSKADAIWQGEVAMTKLLTDAGFKAGYYCRFSGQRLQWANPACLRAHVPVLKIKQNENIYKQHYEKF